MKRLICICSAVVLSLCGLLAIAQESETAPRIENIRIGVDGAGTTRVVFDLTDRPSFVVTPTHEQAPVIRVAISQGSLAMGARDMPSARGLVQRVSASGGMVTIVLTTPSLPVTSFVISPNGDNKYHRLVIDIRETTLSKFDARVDEAVRLAALEAVAPSQSAPESGADTEAPTPKSISEPASVADAMTQGEAVAVSELPPAIPTLNPARIMDAQVDGAQIARSLTIVIDPGHGGYDPGSIGSTGLQEKAVTLDAGLKLRDELVRRGYKVILTRDDDTFIDLARRIEFARSQGADLFLSLHADANPEPLARGATVYTLSDERSQKMAAAAVDKGNFDVFDLDRQDDVSRDVGSILFDLANTDTKNESVKLASSIIPEMRGRVPMVRNTHRRMSLQVLLSPDVPAVLVELAFLSNKKDEANLASDAWKQKAISAVADGIDAYVDENPRRWIVGSTSRHR